MAYSRLALTTGTNVRIRASASTKGATVTQVADEGSCIWTSGEVVSTSNGYDWYAVSYCAGSSSTWYTGYMVSNYLNVINENLSLSSNGYSLGTAATVSWSSLYAGYDYVNVSYTLSDSKGNVLYTGFGTSTSIDLQNYYSNNETVTLTLTASYSHECDGLGTRFQVPSHSTSMSITAKWIGLGNPGTPTVTYGSNAFNVSWTAATISNGNGTISYKIIYGDSVNGYGKYTSSSTTSTSLSISRWVTPTLSEITCRFYIVATYSSYTSSSGSKDYILPAPSYTWSDNKVTVSQIGYQAKVSWNPVTINNNYGSWTPIYHLFHGSDNVGEVWSGTSTSATIDPVAYNTSLAFYVSATHDNVYGIAWSDTNYTSIRKPEITAQPAIQSISPSSGKSTTMSWSAASTVGTNSSTVIYYQYFVGPSSTYSDSYHVGTTTSLSATITQQNIIDKCGNSFTGTCYIFVRAYWKEGTTTGGWSVPTASKFTYDPVELSAPGTPTVTQSGQTFKVSWSAASASGGSGNVTYTVIYSSAGTTVNAGTATSVSIPVSSLLHGTSVSFKVRASYSGKTADSGSKSLTAQAPYINDFGSPTVTQTGYQAKVEWNAASISYGTGSETITYELYCGNEIDGAIWTGTATSVTVTPRSYNTQYGYYVLAYSSGVISKWSGTTYATIRRPVITKQPSITSVSPSSGKSVSIAWSAAEVSNISGETVYYQYFVGPKSTYSDSYHVGTTTNLSATISQQSILDKCGSSFSGTCYLFVRAYWSGNNTTDGWTTPSYSGTFIYDPVYLGTPNAPRVTQSGKNFVVSWDSVEASGGSGDVTYIVVYGEGDIQYAQSATSITFAIHESFYGKSVNFQVQANYSGQSEQSGWTYFTPSAPSVTTPGKPVVSQNGEQYVISWSAATGSYGEGSVTYQVIVAGVYSYQAGTATQISISIKDEWYDSAIQFIVYAYYDSAESNSKITTYTATCHRTVSYYTGSSWVECIVYYYNGSDWIECIPYYYNDEWKLCSCN